jgi:hypothetical protein
MDEHSTPPRRPRAEPEIIPPGAEKRRERDTSRVWIFTNSAGTQRTVFAKPGLFTLILGALVLGALAVATAVLVVGAFVILVPAAALLVGTLVLASLIRGYRRGV